MITEQDKRKRMDDIKWRLWKIEEWTYTREVSALVINYVVSNEKAAKKIKKVEHANLDHMPLKIENLVNKKKRGRGMKEVERTEENSLNRRKD